MIRYNVGYTNIKLCKTTFTDNFPQIWPLSCIFPLLTEDIYTTDSIIRYNVGYTNIKLCKTTFTDNFPQIWPLSCIFPLLTDVGCLPLTLKKKP